MRIGLVAVLAVWSVRAQTPFTSLSPNGDGTALYFSSPLRLKGTDQFPHPKIFVWEQGRGVRLYAQREAVLNIRPGWSGNSSATAHNLLTPVVSGDGRTLGITAIRDCNIGSPCSRTFSLYETEVRRTGADPVTYPGTVSLSPNGRFLLLGSPIIFPTPPDPLTMVDLATGVETKVASWSRPPHRHGVANDASTIVSRQGGTMFRDGRTGEERSVAVPGVNTLIDAAAGRAFFLYSFDTGARLNSLDLRSGASRELAILNGRGPASFDISDDGEVSACLVGGRVWVLRTENPQPAPIGVSEAVDLALSGDGSKLFLVTPAAAILRVNLQTMHSEEIVAETPYLDRQAVVPGLVRGALVPFGGVLRLEGAMPRVEHATFAGRELTILAAGPASLELHVPWDAPAIVERVVLDIAGETRSAFQSSFVWPAVFALTPHVPQWVQRDGVVAALHEDFSGAVTRENPARPGEVIHAYGTGFGPVLPVPEGAAPAPASPLSIAMKTPECAIHADSGQWPVEVVWAGLAPGYIGLYQLDLRLPRAPGAVAATLSCGLGLPADAASGFLPIGQ